LQARDAGVTKHIQAGGGLFSRDDITAVNMAGASSVVVVGSATFIVPHKINGLVDYALGLRWQ